MRMRPPPTKLLGAIETSLTMVVRDGFIWAKYCASSWNLLLGQILGDAVHARRVLACADLKSVIAARNSRRCSR
jgi:hypothetical protein